MQKSYDGMFADKQKLKEWALDLHNSLGGFKATIGRDLGAYDMQNVNASCEVFVLQWNTQMLQAIKDAEEE